MGSKIVLALLIFVSVGYVFSLKCYICTSTSPCEDPATEYCDSDKDYCVSLKDGDTYGKGCVSNDNYCDSGNYDDCSVCQSDLCNS
ncbi:hypothetical protein WA026_007832 [Henosepilachna vigintioctopunctata]|uniref:Uncharacterized protein n=1 Tax=Henosepilachna vigintioctopunctata TaxID=420089 RepID=A0AAW1U457_9CUCU